MFDSSKPDDDVVNFVSKLKSHMQSLHPKPPKHHGKRPVFIHPGLLEATHVFLRRDMLRRPLQQPYDGPFEVLQRKDKVFFLDINGKRVSVSIDRCKPAFFLNTEDLQLPQTKNETPATVEPNVTAPTPATVEHDPTASTPTQPSTRSGRKVHLPTSSSSCSSASSSNARELDEQILEVKINPKEKNTVSDTSTNKDTLSKEKVSENENEETKLIRNDFAHYVRSSIGAAFRDQILKLGPYQPEGNFQKDAKGRSFSSSYYSFISKGGQKIERKWLCYSTRLYVAYCQVCWLFADRTNMYFAIE
ncbi:integrase catalytic domain-containing protein [Trichonephila clavipes]|nr:integrase catalytic domain-containing protein [Trichonephila clavipes]